MYNTLTPSNLSVGVGIEKFKSLCVMEVTDDLHLLGKTLFETNAIFLALSFLYLFYLILETFAKN